MNLGKAIDPRKAQAKQLYFKRVIARPYVKESVRI